MGSILFSEGVSTDMVVAGSIDHDSHHVFPGSGRGPLIWFPILVSSLWLGLQHVPLIEIRILRLMIMDGWMDGWSVFWVAVKELRLSYHNP